MRFGIQTKETLDIKRKERQDRFGLDDKDSMQAKR